MTAPQPVLNKAEMVKTAFFWDKVAEDAKSRADQIRGEMTALARAELERDGVAPTWRIPGFGTLSLGIEQDSVAVIDERAYLKWVERAHPSEVETVTRVRQVWGSHYLKYLAKRGAVIDDEGTVVPGLEFRPGGAPRGVAIRAEPAAKAETADLARAFLDSLTGNAPAAGGEG
jgi:hypothetical protein